MRVFAGLKMRVFMTTDCVGGVWNYAITLARALQPLGVTTTLATLGPAASIQQRSDAQAIHGLDLLETGLPLDWLADDEAAIAHSARHIADLSRAHAADVIHLNSPVLAALATFTAPVIGVSHSCVATWWDATCTGPLPADFQWRTDLVARGYAACDTLIAPSAAYAAMVAARYGITPATVSNGAPAVKTASGIPKERFVLTAGRLWDEGKNFATLDAAAAVLDAPVYAAGLLSHPPHNVTACTNAIHIGQLPGDMLQHWMQHAAIFASVAVYEPFGLAVLEAAQHGCALVLSDTPGFREIWRDYAVFVPPRDADKLATVLQHLLDNPDQQSRLGQAARQRAQRYDHTTMARSMIDIYRQSAAHHGWAA
jgi:glycosyltransferase involved in cell wall biosynthesis